MRVTAITANVLAFASGILLLASGTSAAAQCKVDPQVLDERYAHNQLTHAANAYGFSWAGGIEDTFIPQTKPGLRPLEEYELTQHYEQWQSDIDRAASLGITKLRWGVPWYRVEPKRGHFDWQWTDKVLTYMIDKKHIDPIVDLVHYGTPTWMEGSFTNTEYATAVAEYASAFAERYKNKVKFYTPLNEPTVNAHFAGRVAQWPPYLKGDHGYVRVLLPIARGIQLSATAIRKQDPSSTLVAVEAMRLVRPTAPGADEQAKIEFNKDMLCWDLVSGKVDEHHPLYKWLIDNGASVEKLGELRANPVQQDIFGVNLYPWSIKDLVAKNGKIIEEQGPEQGRLLAEVLRQCDAHTGKPLFVTETSSTGDTTKRSLWMSETIDAVRVARSEGVPVVGYTWFPLITMVDWDYRTGHKTVDKYLLNLGLWDSKFDADGVLVRHETPLVASYRDWIRMGMPTPRELAVSPKKTP